MAQLIRYKWVILALLADSIIFICNSVLGRQIALQTTASFLEMLSVIPPIFIILGLLDTWVPREKVVSHLGVGSGMKGIALATILGAAAAGPLYGAFPVAAVMMKKGASFFNVIIFVGAWATLKVPMFMFEIQYLGGTFAVTRWICSLVGIVLIAVITDWFVSPQEKEIMYAKQQGK